MAILCVAAESHVFIKKNEKEESSSAFIKALSGGLKLVSAAIFSFPFMFTVAGCKLHCESLFVSHVVYFVFCLFIVFVVD